MDAGNTRGRNKESGDDLKIFDALSSEERVNALIYLRGKGEPVNIQDVSEEADTSVARLHHVHLPKLDDLGLVNYDREGRKARYTGGEDVKELLEWAGYDI